MSDKIRRLTTMKIEIEIPDLEEVYCSYYEDDTINGKDLKKIIADKAIAAFIEQLYNEYMNDTVYDYLKNDVKEIVKNHSNDIIDSVIEKVSRAVIKQKSILNELPKRSEINAISKEWEDYFLTLVDKAIAKRFK